MSWVVTAIVASTVITASVFKRKAGRKMRSCSSKSVIKFNMTLMLRLSEVQTKQL
jgi:hypothetical protein